jgi:hypothetical protein
MSFRSDASTSLSPVMVAAALWATVGVAVQVTPEATTIPDTLIMMALVSGEGRLPPDLANVPALRLGLLVAYLGLLPTALAYLCSCSGMAKCRTPVVGRVASMIEPLLAALLLGERISPGTVGGCALLIGGNGPAVAKRTDAPCIGFGDPERPKDHPGLRGNLLQGAASTTRGTAAQFLFLTELAVRIASRKLGGSQSSFLAAFI